MSGEKQNPHRGDPMPVDVLLFGAHPDDVEWGAGGSALILKARGSSFGVVDLTRGEMGSRGTSEERDKEAQKRHPRWVPGFVKISACLIAESWIR